MVRYTTREFYILLTLITLSFFPLISVFLIVCSSPYFYYHWSTWWYLPLLTYTLIGLPEISSLLTYTLIDDILLSSLILLLVYLKISYLLSSTLIDDIFLSSLILLLFYELIDVVFIERLRDLTSGIWISLVNISRVLQIFLSLI